MALALQYCWCHGFTKIIFEKDNKKMVDVLTSKVLQFGLYNWVRERRQWMNKFKDIELRWICRQGNMVADKIAKENIPAENSFQSYSHVPNTCIKTLYVQL